MEQALYGPDGFYTRGGLAGRRGDFLTAPEVGPLFGAVLARFLDAEWQRLGRASPFTVVDVGAGPGTLARSIVAAAPACRAALRYIAVEVADVQRRSHPAGVESRADLPTESIVGVVIANELLDNLPFRLAVFDGAWREAYVSSAADGALTEVLSAPFDPVPDVLPATPPLGARAPLIDAARSWLDGARRLVRSGSVIAFDYTVDTTSELALRQWREWLRTYRRHERGGHYLAAPGEQDVTTDVPLDQLPAPDERWTRPSSSGNGASRSSSRRGSGPGQRPPPSRTSLRWPCAAGPERPRPCSIRPDSAPHGGGSGARRPIRAA